MTIDGHVPVLLSEALKYLGSERTGTYVDATLGLAGHSLEILKRNAGASIAGFDRDEISLREAQKRLAGYAERIQLFHADFRDLLSVELDFSSVRGVLIDLGISSFQLDAPERGFSFNAEGPLDMRLDHRTKTTAAKILEKYPESKLEEVFRKYGELSRTRRLAREIATRRKLRPFETTSQLRRLIEDIYLWRPQKGKLHPAAKVFQALRIEVNQELGGLADFLARLVPETRPGTRFVIISFHSLEDRIVKKTFVELAGQGERAPMLRILTKKPVVPGETERRENPRSRSAKLRAAERI